MLRLNSKKNIHKLSLVMVILGVCFSYILSDIHTGQSAISQNNLGWLTVLQFSFISFFMLLAWWSMPRIETLKQAGALLFIALLIRLILIPVDPYTSNDVDRYLFDGKIVLAGLDPYQVNHNDPMLQELKTQWAPPEEHAKYPTLYPPLSLALFSVVAMAGPDYAPFAWKCIVTFAGIATLFLMALLLKKIKRLHHLPLIALSPLLILETGIGVHLDSITTLFVVLALYLFHKHHLSCSGFFIGLGVLTKVLPIMLLIPLFFGLKKIKDSLQISLATIITVLTGYLATLAFGLIPIGSIGILFEKWRFGSPIFSFLESLASDQNLLLIIMSFIVLASLIIALKSFRLTEKINITNALLPWSMAAVLLLSPVIFPWYLMPLLPLIALSPRPFMLTWVCTLPLTYEVLGGFSHAGEWSPASWPLVIIALGFSVSLYYEFQRNSNVKNKTAFNIHD